MRLKSVLQAGCFGLAFVVMAGETAAESVPAGAYLAARQATNDGDFSEAAAAFVQALLRDPANPALMQGAVESFLALGNIDSAIPVAKQITDLGLRSQAAHMVLMTDAVRREDWDQILQAVEEKRGIGPLVDGLVAGWAKLGKGDMAAALAGFDAVSAQDGLEGFGIYHKALALALVGDFESAEEIFAAMPQSVLQSDKRAAMAYIQILSQLDKPQEAIAFLDAAYGPDPDANIAALRSELAAGKPLPFTGVMSPRDGVAEVFYTVAGALLSEADSAYALQYTRVAFDLSPHNIDALLLSAELLEDLGQYDLAVESYSAVPNNDPASVTAALGRARALTESGKEDAAVEALAQLAKQNPDDPLVQASLGDALRRQKNYPGAIEAYSHAIARNEARGDAQWFVHYARGICYERSDQWDAAEADFRKALELNPGQPQVLNYLGYSLVEKNIKLDEALEMIRQAVGERPDSGHIVDSLGWVLYRLGRYDEAVGHMERAAELMPVDPIVNDHLGDVFWAVGRKREARFQWQRALSFDPEDQDADRIRRKLEVGLDAVLQEEGAAPLNAAQTNEN